MITYGYRGYTPDYPIFWWDFYFSLKKNIFHHCDDTSVCLRHYKKEKALLPSKFDTYLPTVG